MPETMLNLALDPPLVSRDGTTLASLKLREPTIGEMDEASKEQTNEANTARLVSLVAGIPLPLARALPISVARLCDEYLSGFMPENSMAAEDAPAPLRDIVLAAPVTVKGAAPLEVLSLREPTIGAMDMARRQQRAFAYMAALIAQSSGISILQANALPISVGQEALNYLMGFSRPKPAG